MAWEPWFSGEHVAEQQEPYDPEDPRLLVNILVKDETDEEREKKRDWVMNFIGKPPE